MQYQTFDKIRQQFASGEIDFVTYHLSLLPWFAKENNLRRIV
jgi:type IV secretory pathway VirB4 component